jgi:hypothetical protein
VLVALLKSGPAELAETAEGMLQEVAGARAPMVEWKDNKEQREKSHAAWLAWWQQHKDSVEIPKAEVPGLWIVNPERQVKDVGIKLFYGFAHVDKDSLRKLAAVPFHWGDGRVFQTMDDLHTLVNKEGTGKEAIQSWPFHSVMRLKDFAKITRPAYRAYIESLKGGNFYVVCFGSPANKANNNLMGLVVRIRGATARAIGVVAS